jgi:predicted outer membrane repeat protein
MMWLLTATAPLREAIIAANTDTAVDGCAAGSGHDIITLPPGTYTLTLAGTGEDGAQTGDLDLTASVTINGAGLAQTIIDGNGLDRVFDVHNQATVTINGMTIRNGSAPTGGGVNVNNGGDLTLSHSRVTSNTATSSGGGIFVSGLLTLNHSRVDVNSTGNGGGGGLFISFNTNPAIISHSEISGNSTAASGGGIFTYGQLILVNSTLSGNSAGHDGGGLLLLESPAVALYNVTISGNMADADGDGQGDGGGLRILGGLSAANTLVGGNSDNSGAGNQFHDCAGTLTSQGYNLVANVSGCNIVGDTTGNLVGVDPLLGPLQNNGGPTLSHALLDGSPAIDAGNPDGCRDHNGNLLTTDQRGFARPAAGSPFCDIGAYEAGAADAPTPTPTATAVPIITPTPSSWNYLPVILKCLRRLIIRQRNV